MKKLTRLTLGPRGNFLAADERLGQIGELQENAIIERLRLAQKLGYDVAETIVNDNMRPHFDESGKVVNIKY